MKPGDKFLVMFEVKRLALPFEIVEGRNAGSNHNNNLFIAAPAGKEGPISLICSDEWPEMPNIPPGLEGANFKT